MLKFRIIQITTDIISLYLVIKREVKLTVKTTLMSPFKDDLNVFIGVLI